jgi:hypothetical protein
MFAIKSKNSATILKTRKREFRLKRLDDSPIMSQMTEAMIREPSFITTIEPEKGRNKLTINSRGARITELILKGRRILTSVTRGDGKIGSTTHPCIPIFGPETTTSFGIPQHGSARDKDFKVIPSDTDVQLSQKIVDGTYPDGLCINQVHALVNGTYILETEITNYGNHKVPVNFAEHFYWAAPKGWEGLRINGVDVTDVVKRDSSIKIEPENLIEIPGQKPIILRQKGFSVLKLWVYKNPKTGEYDKNYVCIEPAEGDPDEDYFGSEESIIKPRQSRATEITIEIK